MKPFIGISRIWYGAPWKDGSDAPSPSSIKKSIDEMWEIKNSHDGTWKYEQDDPETTDYVNELTGRVYYQDKVKEGASKISFTMGVFSFLDKSKLQGGEEVKVSNTSVGWKSKVDNDVIHKGIIAQTKTGNFIVFTNAAIVAKADTQEKNVGLGVVATSMECDNENIAAEYWFDGSSIQL